MRFLLPLTFLLAACGGDDGGDDEPFDTFQECFDDHHKVEDNDVVTSIKICCIDHPIGGQDANVVCGATTTACQAFVDDNIADADATLAEITSACDGYITDRDL
jgi:hypothetical protein